MTNHPKSRISESDAKDFIGRRFGKLVVIGFVWSLEKRMTLWRCLCDCGKETLITRSHLISGAAKSCNCARHRPPGESGLLRLFNVYRVDSRKKTWKKNFEISFEDFKKITSQNCVYCGAPPSRVMKIYSCSTGYSSYQYNGMDRVDSSKGYEKDNVVPCCTRCNLMKLTYSREDFLTHAMKIYKFNKKELDSKDDIDVSECLMTQLKYKAEED